MARLMHIAPCKAGKGHSDVGDVDMGASRNKVPAPDNGGKESWLEKALGIVAGIELILLLTQCVAESYGVHLRWLPIAGSHAAQLGVLTGIVLALLHFRVLR